MKLRKRPYAPYHDGEPDYMPGDFTTAGVDGIVTHYIIACPGCGELGSLDGRWKTESEPGDFEHLTLSPSVHCVGCCGWHGYFRNGEAVTA